MVGRDADGPTRRPIRIAPAPLGAAVGLTIACPGRPGRARYGPLVELGVALEPPPPELLSEYPTPTRGSAGMRPRTYRSTTSLAFATQVLGTKMTAFGRRRTRSGTPLVSTCSRLMREAANLPSAVGRISTTLSRLAVGRNPPCSMTACSGVIPGTRLTTPGRMTSPPT